MSKHQLTVAAAALTLALSVSVFAADRPEPVNAATNAADLSALSISEMETKASAYVKDIDEKLTDAFNKLADSIAKGDTPAINARNEAVTAMKGLVRLADSNLRALREAKSRGDRKRVEHEYVKISIAHSRVNDFYAQVLSAEGGPLNLELTDVERELTFDWTLPVVEDLSSYFLDPLVNGVPDPPVHASPYF